MIIWLFDDYHLSLLSQLIALTDIELSDARNRCRTWDHRSHIQAWQTGDDDDDDDDDDDEEDDADEDDDEDDDNDDNDGDAARSRCRTWDHEFDYMNIIIWWWGCDHRIHMYRLHRLGKKCFNSEIARLANPPLPSCTLWLLHRLKFHWNSNTMRIANVALYIVTLA